MPYQSIGRNLYRRRKNHGLHEIMIMMSGSHPNRRRFGFFVFFLFNNGDTETKTFNHNVIRNKGPVHQPISRKNVSKYIL